jgi:LDH2 family malate/lactate/ureidoglycolate dehydrogenase
MTTIRSDYLLDFTVSLLTAAGLSTSHAQVVAGKLLESNLLGVDSHGVLRLPTYIRRLLSGAMNPTPSLRVVKRNGAVSLLDADNAPGMLGGHEAMLEAMRLTDNHQVGVCGVINSNHFGAAGVYARMAAARNMIGVSMTNVAPLMTIPGVPNPLVGNNPFAVAFPVRSGSPIALDISLSNVAQGKLLLASRRGESIPSDWAVDKDGIPTTDPDAGFEGYLLPVGGHKGFGLALVVELLCGVFTGGAFLHQLRGMYRFPNDPSVTAHLMMAICADAILELDAFLERVEEFRTMLKSVPPRDPNVTVMWPGEPEERILAQRSTQGIPVQDSLAEELNALASQLGLEKRLPAGGAA